MANIDDYVSGKILTDTKWAFFLLKFVKVPILGYKIKKELIIKVKAFEPKVINIKLASLLINESQKCAAGERVCRVLYKNSEFTESVFLDGLAEGMTKIGSARYVTKQEAIRILKKYSNRPLIISKVSGSYVELCRSWPPKCVYWNMERCGLKCLEKN